MEEQLLSLAKNLMSIHSTREKAGEIEEMMEVLQIAQNELNGFTVEKFNHNSTPSLLVYNAPSRPEKFKVILNAHLDVVPGHEYQLTPTIKNGRLYGRGAYDMKAAAAVEILVFKELAKQVSYPLALQLVTDEETGGGNGTKMQVQQGIKSDFILVGEPTDLNITNKLKGVLWLKLTTKGTKAHGAYPWNGENAIMKMYAVLNRITTAFPTPESEEWVTTVNISHIETSNNTINVVPEDCMTKLDIRYLHGEGDRIVEEIKNLVGDDAKIEIITKDHSLHTDEENIFVQTLIRTTKEVIGKPSPLIARHGSTDIRFFTEMGCSGVEFGPIGGGQHSDEEWVDIKSLETYYNILKTFLLDLH